MADEAERATASTACSVASGKRGRPVPGFRPDRQWNPCALTLDSKDVSPARRSWMGYRCPNVIGDALRRHLGEASSRTGGTVLLCDRKKATVRALPDQAPGHREQKQFHWRRSLLNAVAVGVLAFGGVTGGAATVDDIPFTEALRHAVPVGPVVAGLAFAISWLIPALDRRVPRRTEGGSRTDRST